MNVITLDGRLGADPEVRYSASGNCTAKISLGETYYRKAKESGESERKTRWHKCVFFGKRADTISEHATKGTHLLVSGELDYYAFNDDSGSTVKVAEVIVGQFQFLGSGKDKSSDNTAQSDARVPASAGDTGYDDTHPF